MTLMIMVDWYGPFTTIDAAKESESAEVLYLATGRRRYQRVSSLQYVGISNDLNDRFNDKTHKIKVIYEDLRIWVGYVTSHAVAGRRAVGAPVAHSVGVEQAEWMIAYFLAMPLNERKRRKPPTQSSVLVNRWFDSNADRRRVHRRHKKWPDLIEYDKERDFAMSVWFGGKRDRFSHADIKALALPPKDQSEF